MLVARQIDVPHQMSERKPGFKNKIGRPNMNISFIVDGVATDDEGGL
jgi:hypothetical protein